MRGKPLVDDLHRIIAEAGAEIVDERVQSHIVWRLKRKDGGISVFTFSRFASNRNRGEQNTRAALKRILR